VRDAQPSELHRLSTKIDINYIQNALFVNSKYCIFPL